MSKISPLPLANAPNAGLGADRLTHLADRLRKVIDSGRLPGAVALVSRRGKIALFEAFGVRDPATGAPMQTDSIFRIYSMTKPMVSVAAMTLFEEGEILLGDPLARYIPDFANAQVAVERDGKIELEPARRAITIQDLLRHTSGLTYEITGTTPVQKMYVEAKIFRRDQTCAQHAETLAKLPLRYHPGTRWDYSRSTDVLGRVIEVVSGKSLGEFLAERIIGPLGMADTAFYVPASKHSRLAEAFAQDPDTGAAVQLLDVRDKPMFESGGGGLASTAMDYARFCQMLANGGTLDGVRILGRKTIEFMTADHLGAIAVDHPLIQPGFGFGLGFTVRLQAGLAPLPGSVGQYSWGGLSGTSFWIDPREQLFAILLTQAPGQRDYSRALFRDLVYASIAD